MCDKQYCSKFWLVKNKIKKNVLVLPGNSFDLESIQNHVNFSLMYLLTHVQATHSYSLGVQYDP